MKLGITMEGGASRTVFSCGVADALLEENIMPEGQEPGNCTEIHEG